jgi:hypothetical protein
LRPSGSRIEGGRVVSSLEREFSDGTCAILWEYDWAATPGPHSLALRALDGSDQIADGFEIDVEVQAQVAPAGRTEPGSTAMRGKCGGT